ncbi:DUF3489 domain-containing protein [Novosphingobium sp. Gsoil 351]|uniref:DUF3489 domain-containing protein n=1 Tax=Novosphingobium sp. Gsoil 351 TaxID=2675225 RepID=UPI0018A8484E|nr:DUF3489 domain-containing protein [Novosphingobium sp. Gsoil 351]
MIRKTTNAPSRVATRGRKPRSQAQARKGAAPENAKGLQPPPRSKNTLVMELLGQPGGVSIDELMAATGWQSHSVRAALTTLRHKRHAIVRTTRDGISRYAITPADPAVSETITDTTTGTGSALS